MKITDVMIDRYGVWSDLLLPVNESGMTVIYGPNEAGKSTLMRFIRGVLYGFPAAGMATAERGDHTQGWGGSLRVKSQHQSLQLSRHIDEHGRQQFRANANNKSMSETEFERILQDVDADIYRTIYTLGLKELRELATLQTDQVGEFIYGSSLGRIGQRLMHAEQQTRHQAFEIADLEQSRGHLFDLSGQYGSMHEALSKTDGLINRYESHLTECRQLESQQEDRRERLSRLKRERSNYRYMQRVWNPWKKHRDLQNELRMLPEGIHFPADGLSRLEKLDAQKKAAEEQLKNLRRDRSRIKQALETDKSHTELRDHASGVRALIDLKSLVESAERHLANVSADASMLKSELDEKLQTLGSDWTINRLAEVDTSPQAHLQLSTSARNYQTAISRRARHRRRYRKVSDAHHQRQSELQDKLKRQNITSLPQAIREAERRLVDLENLAQLRVREAEYEQRIRSAKTQLVKQDDGREIPWWGQSMLTLFSMVGGFLIIAGLVQSVQTSWIIGWIYLLTGIMGGGLAWSLRQHFEMDNDGYSRRLHSEIETCERELNDVRGRISRISGEVPHRRSIPAELQNRNRKSETELIQQASQRIVDLQAMSRTQEKLQKTRKKLSVQRGKLGEYQRDVSATRQAWCDLLNQLGIRETVRTSEAFLSWQHAVDAQQTWQQWQASKDDVQRHQELLNQFREQMEMIAGRMSLRSSDGLSLSQTLNNWQKMLHDFDQSHNSYLQKKRDYSQVVKQYRDAETKLNRHQDDLSQLLRQAEVTSPEEFRRRAKQLQRAEELRALISDLNDQLNSLSKEEPELAIAEEDLLRYESSSNQERIEMLDLEIEDLEKDIADSQEKLGRMRQTLATLESDTSADDLRTKQARILDRASASLRDLQANRIASSALSRLTAEFEQRFQPETLARASEYLDKLTCGKYNQVRTPVGSRALLIREQNGLSRNVGELSDGTREQLFLAIRMALIDTFAEDGIEMPVVFDDIFVNFDQQRTEAAVETLLDFAATRQVLFFTCHQHLATMFENQQIESIWLPALAKGETRLAG